jgi:hypothetical protein
LDEIPMTYEKSDLSRFLGQKHTGWFERALATKWQRGFGLDQAQFTARAFDDLKMLGTANATGALSLAAFLSTVSSKSPFAAILLGKVTFCVFAIGVAAFGMGYSTLRSWALSMDHGVTSLGAATSVEEGSPANKAFREADREYVQTGVAALISLTCLCLGSLLAVLGVLFAI